MTQVLLNLEGSPYSLEATGGWILDEAAELHEHVELLREQGKLTEQTLRAYFGNKRFEQIAESNALKVARSVSARRKWRCCEA